MDDMKWKRINGDDEHHPFFLLPTPLVDPYNVMYPS